MVILKIALASVFTFAAVAKTVDRRKTQQDFTTLALPDSSLVVLLAIAADALVAMLLVFFPLAGFALATTILSIYTIILLLALLHRTNPTCACFGAVSSGKINYLTIVRNIVLLTAAMVGLIAA